MGTAENIKKLRARYGLTQEDLASIAGVTNRAVSSWEQGLKEPRMGAIEKIAGRFNLKKSNLIEDGGMDINTLAEVLMKDKQSSIDLIDLIKNAESDITINGKVVPDEMKKNLIDMISILGR